MNGITVFCQDLLAILKNKKILIPVLVVILVPLLYSSMFLWAFWDPYSKLDHLPVALVNLDKGANYNGKTLNIGKDLIEKLNDSKKFKWQLVDMKTAKEGLAKNKYYMAIEIPANFSQKATTVMDKNPTTPEFYFLPNESYNFLASQIGENAVDRIKTEVNNSMTEAYTRAIFDNIATLSSGLQNAGSGAAKIARGAESAANGMDQINNNMNKLASSTLPLTQGINRLSQGSGSLTLGIGSLEQGTNRLSSGLGQLSQAYGQIHNGFNGISQGTDQLSSSLLQLKDANSQLVSAANQSQTGIKQLAGGLNTSLDGLQQEQTGITNVANSLKQYAAAHPEIAQDPSFQKLLAGSQAAANGMQPIINGQQKLAAGASQLDAGQTKLIDGLNTFSEGLASTQNGSNSLKQNSAVLLQASGQFNQKLADAAKGSASLELGSAELLQGSQSVDSGLQQVNDGLSRFKDGAFKLAAGTQQVTGGIQTLTNGTETLANKLTTAAGKTASIHGSNANYEMFANHVQMDKEEFTKVPNYGTGFAPYFLSLGLFVGALLLTIVLPLREPAIVPKSAFSWFISKFMLLMLIGIAQALVADSVLLYGLGLHVKNVELFILFSIITSMTFMAIIQFLVTAFDNPGRFVAIVILILQLITSAGTFPLELIPAPLQLLNAWLPMTYSVSGLKAVISSGDFAYMWQNASVLLLFIAAACIGTISYFMLNYKHTFAVKEFAASSMSSLQMAIEKDS